MPDRVFVLGLDGSTFTLLKPWAAQGKLPQLRRLLEGGAHGTLRSTYPPLTPPAWTTSFTGVNPGKHNIYGFFKPMRGSYRRQVYAARDIRAPKLWEIVGAYGKQSVILHLPLTYPVDPINGIMVAGMTTPNQASDYTHPPELRAELEGAIAGYRLNVDTNAIRAGLLREFYQECLELTRIQCAETLYLMERKPWDLFYVMLHNVDQVKHFFWKFMEPSHPYYPGPNQFENAILSVYQEVDHLVGRLLERLDSDTHLVVLSDHGFQMTSKNVFLANWLARQGLLVLHREKGFAFRRALFRAGIQREKLVKRLEAMHLEWLPKLFPERLKDQVPLSRPSYRNMEDYIDWSHTQAYFPSAGGLAVFLNVRGREPQGIVEPGSEYDALREKIMDQLLQITDAGTGARVIRAVFKREEVYHGDSLENAPDILMLPEDGYFINEGLGNEIVTWAARDDTERSGNHHLEGIIAVFGNRVQPGRELHGARIEDVAPTVLHLLGLPVQRNMDGAVLLEALHPDFVRDFPVRFDSISIGQRPEGFDYTTEERSSIEERLQGMGYM